ncbi:hypothetical protein KKE60_08225 [Patescibacteria group bacterium]|nr:hypothetical protein [Patescibacteria group bacterium]
MAKRLKCWKKNPKTGYPVRWDEKEGSGVVVVNEVHRVKTRKPFKFEEKPSFEAMYSYATGGWYSLGVEKNKSNATELALNFMDEHDVC